MKPEQNIVKNFEGLLTLVKKMEESTAVFSELGKISSELQTLHQYIEQGLSALDQRYEAFQDSIELLSNLVDFQRKIIPCRSSEKTIETIIQYLQKNIPYDDGFMLYKLKEEDNFELVSLKKEQTNRYLDFLGASQIQKFLDVFEQSDQLFLITDPAAFHPDVISWKLIPAKSAILFPLKARGHLFGIGILIRTRQSFEMREQNFTNLVNGLLSLIIYQNFYFARLKSRLLQQSKALKALENIKYADFFDNGPLLFFTLDARFVVLHANNAVLREIVLEGDSIIGEDFFEIIPPSHRNPFRKFLVENQDKSLQIFRCPLYGVNGKLAVMEFMSSRLRMTSNSDLILVLAGDVTENYYKELTEHRNEILDEIDQFSRILVNQFNNLLTTILPNIELMKKGVSDGHPYQAHVESIEKAARRSANLIQKFLNYDVEGPEIFENTNLNKLLNAYISGRKKEMPSNIRVSMELDPTIKNTRTYPMRIRRLLDILINNSIIALQDRANPGIKLSTTFIKQKNDGIVKDKPFYLKQGDYIELCVRDNGLGIPEKSVHQVLKPFYSTRVKNEGVGLELFFAYNLVKDMKGHIYLDSRMNEYTEVCVYLPFKEEIEMSTRPVAQGKIEHKALAKKATILVVDDEYNIRSMMKEIMEMSGLKVFTAGNGRDGVDIYQRYRKDIDLIIMDMVMPIMDGRAAFNEIRKINPKQKIFIISGYSQREDLEDMLDNGAVGFLRKPFQVKEIVEKVSEILSLS